MPPCSVFLCRANISLGLGVHVSIIRHQRTLEYVIHAPSFSPIPSSHPTTSNNAQITRPHVQIASFPVGSILDRFGPKRTGILGSLLFLLGCVGFVTSLLSHQWDLVIPAFMLLALGGPAIFLSTLHLSQALPRFSSLIMALLSGGFDMSVLVFLLFNVLANQFGIDASKLFLYYLVVPICVLVYNILLMPNTSFEKDTCDTNSQDEQVTRCDSDDEETVFGEQENSPLLRSGPSSDTLQATEAFTYHDKSLLYQLCSWEFAYVIIGFVRQVTLP